LKDLTDFLSDAVFFFFKKLEDILFLFFAEQLPEAFSMCADIRSENLRIHTGFENIRKKLNVPGLLLLLLFFSLKLYEKKKCWTNRPPSLRGSWRVRKQKS
jgi:hypothetical protein